MVNGKQFYHQEKEEEQRIEDKNIPPAHTHTQHGTITPQTVDEQKLACDDKTAYSTTRYRRSQNSVSGWGYPWRRHRRVLGVHREEDKASKHKLKTVS